MRLPELADDPDAVFVEDTALLLDGHAVITRPGIASRAGETESTAAGLAGHFEVHRIDVRLSSTAATCCASAERFTSACPAAPMPTASERLADIVGPLGYTVVASRTSRLPAPENRRDIRRARTRAERRCCYTASARSIRRSSPVSSHAVDEHEPAAANCLRVADRLILPAGNPRTAERLRERGFQVVEVDVSELQKAEAGVTCMSLIDERPSG